MAAKFILLSLMLGLGFKLQQHNCHGSKILWPEGRYALPATTGSCPSSQGFQWATGVVYQDLEDHGNKNNIQPSSNHLDASIVGSDIIQKFCVKDDTHADDKRPKWPLGNYCLFKKGSNCPKPLEEGSVTFENQHYNSTTNKNYIFGKVPAGIYGNNTRFEFCCRRDYSGNSKRVIELPIEQPFFLMQSQYATQCQQVKGALHQMEVITYDTYGSYNENQSNWPRGNYPAGLTSYPNPKINFCYYHACKWKLTKLQGSIVSPYYPKDYQNNAQCEWDIRAPPHYSVEITFHDFQLEIPFFCNYGNNRPCRCDYVEIQEKAHNGSITRTKTYCMATNYIPLGVVQLQFNHVTVLFRSDGSIRERGFNATYEMKPPHLGNKNATSIPTTGSAVPTPTTNASTSRPPKSTTLVPQPTSSNLTSVSNMTSSLRPTTGRVTTEIHTSPFVTTTNTTTTTTMIDQVTIATTNTTSTAHNSTPGFLASLRRTKRTSLIAIFVPLVTMTTCLLIVLALWYSRRRRELNLQIDQLKIHYGDDNEGFGERSVTISIHGDSCKMSNAYEEHNPKKGKYLSDNTKRTVLSTIEQYEDNCLYYGTPDRHGDNHLYYGTPEKHEDNCLYNDITEKDEFEDNCLYYGFPERNEDNCLYHGSPDRYEDNCLYYGTPVRNENLSPDRYEDNCLYYGEIAEEQIIKGRTKSLTSIYGTSGPSVNKSDTKNEDRDELHESLAELNASLKKLRNLSVESINSLYTSSDTGENGNGDDECSGCPLYERLI